MIVTLLSNILGFLLGCEDILVVPADSGDGTAAVTTGDPKQ
jgi:hypothetical protein